MKAAAGPCWSPRQKSPVRRTGAGDKRGADCGAPRATGRLTTRRGASASDARPDRLRLLPSSSSSTGPVPLPGARRRRGRLESLSSTLRRLCSMHRRSFTSLNSTGVDHVFRLRHQDLLNLVLRGLDAVVGGRVAGENLRQRAGLLLFQRLDLFEEVHERRRIVAGLIKVLQAQVIGLGFQICGRTSGSPAGSPGRALPDGVSGPAAHEDQRNAWHS